MISEEFPHWVSSHREIWLFGTGAYGIAIQNYLNANGVNASGFVVSDDVIGTAETEKPVIGITEFKSKYMPDMGLILSISSELYNEIIPKLSFCVTNLYFLEEPFKRQCLRRHKPEQSQVHLYNTGFYEEILQLQKSNATELVAAISIFTKPKSVIDVGCGTGLIGKTFMDFGATEVYGIDGDYIDRALLQFDPECFIPHDLTKPFDSERRYDMAICLEVAEHLDSVFAEQFVCTLCGLSDIVVFSASTPYQGGVNHINEQQQSYWLKLFAQEGYRAIDCIRPIIWDNQRISDYYKQNIILYISNDADENEYLNIFKYVQQPIYDTIHPQMYARVVEYNRELLSIQKEIEEGHS